MYRKQVRKRLSKFKLKLSLIFNFLTYFKKTTSKVKAVFMTFHSNFSNKILFSNQSKILEVEE